MKLNYYPALVIILLLFNSCTNLDNINEKTKKVVISNKNKKKKRVVLIIIFLKKLNIY